MKKKLKKAAEKQKPSSIGNSYSILKKQRIYVILILVFTAFLFSNTINNGFTNWDDEVYLHENPYIQDISFNGIKDIFGSAYFGNYHPLTTLSYALEYNAFGLNPTVFHTTNYLLHLINVLLVFMLIGFFTKKPETQAITALLFAIHPMHVESVAWISERKDVLFTLFYLGTLIFYLKYITKKCKTVYLLYAFLLFTASLMSKSAAVTLPPTMLLLYFYIHKKIPIKEALKTLPFFGLSLVFGIVALKTQEGAMGDLTVAYSWFDRLFISAYALYFYIIRFIFPHQLSALHPFPAPVNGYLPWIYYMAPAVLAVIATGVLLSKKENRHLYIFGLLFFLINIALVIQIISVGQAVVAERYTYIPYIGLSYIAAVSFVNIYSKNHKNIWLGLGSVYLVFLSFTTWQQNKVWQNSGTLWAHALSLNPNLQAGLNNLGLYYSDENRDKESYKLFTRLIEINPDYKDVYNNRATACFKLKDYQCVIDDLNISLKKNADNPKLYNNRGLAKHQLGLYMEAISDFDAAIKLDSHYYEAYKNRSSSKNITNDLTGALNDLDIVIGKTAPDSELYNTRGVIKGKLQDFEGAASDFLEAIRIASANSDAIINLGIAYLNLNNISEACIRWREALMLGNTAANQWLERYCSQY